MTIEPMLRLMAGAFVTASVLIGMYVNPYFIWFTLFVGPNLAQSAFTNWCPMMTALRRVGIRDTLKILFYPPTMASNSFASNAGSVSVRTFPAAISSVSACSTFRSESALRTSAPS